MLPSSHLLGLDGEGELRVLGTLLRLAAAAVGDAVDAVAVAVAAAGAAGAGGLAGNIAGPVAGLQVVTVDETTWTQRWYLVLQLEKVDGSDILCFCSCIRAKVCFITPAGDLITAPISNKSCWFPVKVNLKCILNV